MYIWTCTCTHGGRFLSWFQTGMWHGLHLVRRLACISCTYTMYMKQLVCHPACSISLQAALGKCTHTWPTSPKATYFSTSLCRKLGVQRKYLILMVAVPWLPILVGAGRAYVSQRGTCGVPDKVSCQYLQRHHNHCVTAIKWMPCTRTARCCSLLLHCQWTGAQSELSSMCLL